ncbi:protein bric-a-brac 1-like [Teleopsis dalmanni]|uniref:protein bric-a-brac 1-like n=1 Tax=Teleopsis dalmanni TaxID=139649 RepID=UPI0018CEC576|nr:protein bric-a-brac 1-like [Teleopsis dalmanni]
MLENSHAWMGASSSSIAADSYQYQLQSMWQKCWNTNQNLMHHLRFRERGPLKSWRPETMAEAIFSVLKEGLSLSQAARKYDIPYPTFVLYANRVHNMLGPSIDGGPDLRPKGRGRPQRILLGIWPDEHIKGVIKTVVFRDAKELKEDTLPPIPYGRHSPIFPFPDSPLSYPGVPGPCPNGMPSAPGEQMSQEATAAAVAAVAHNLRQQMQMAAAAQHQHSEGASGANLFNIPPHLQSHMSAAGPGPGGIPLPKASISPALSSASNHGAAGGMLGPRHAPSPCGSLAGLPNLPPSMAAALHMVGGTSAARCDPAAMLSQQQQHQLQQLHLQQQHALHQQQQHQQQQHQQQQHAATHALGFGISSMSHSLTSTTATATATSSSTQKLQLQQEEQQHQQHEQQQQQQHQHTTSAVNTSSSSIIAKPKSVKDSPTQQRSSPRHETPLHSPFTELGLEIGYKHVRGYSPSRLFTEDIAELMGAATATTSSITSSSSASPATSSILSSLTSATGNVATAASAPTSSKISSSSIKIEPITTSSE